MDIRALQMLPEIQARPEQAICRYDSESPTANPCKPYHSGGSTITTAG
ncbi:hypothetical protein [Kribbella deserti]|uniref:Uncharacterized protein n=1 Tax=Kribbella deserti TaxID=1926257 RepID=A0ABV6QMZ9_9ACTN